MPTWLHMIAVVLELGIVSRLLAHGDAAGVGLCLAYLWWSATLDMVRRLVEGGD